MGYFSQQNLITWLELTDPIQSRRSVTPLKRAGRGFFFFFLYKPAVPRMLRKTSSRNRGAVCCLWRGHLQHFCRCYILWEGISVLYYGQRTRTEPCRLEGLMVWGGDHFYQKVQGRIRQCMWDANRHKSIHHEEDRSGKDGLLKTKTFISKLMKNRF